MFEFLPDNELPSTVTVDVSVLSDNELPRIVTVGVGGCGINALNKIIKQDLPEVEFIAVDSDEQTLANSQAPNKFVVGKQKLDDLVKFLENAKMVFVVAGIGGVTGVSVASLVADIVKSDYTLVIGVVNVKSANEDDIGIKHLRKSVDSLITISEDKILNSDEEISKDEVIDAINDIFCKTFNAICRLITTPGVVNIDFVDIKTILNDSGDTFIGIGEASGEKAPINAAKAAIESNLLSKDIEGAQSILINVMGSSEKLTINEVNDASVTVQEAASPDAEIMWGMSIDESLSDTVRVSVIATRFATEQSNSKQPPAFFQMPQAKSSFVLIEDSSPNIQVPPWMR